MFELKQFEGHLLSKKIEGHLFEFEGQLLDTIAYNFRIICLS